MVEVKSAYCPLCNKVFTLCTDLNVIHCPNCNHHLNLKPPHYYDEDFLGDDDETNNL